MTPPPFYDEARKRLEEDAGWLEAIPDAHVRPVGASNRTIREHATDVAALLSRVSELAELNAAHCHKAETALRERDEARAERDALRSDDRLFALIEPIVQSDRGTAGELTGRIVDALATLRPPVAGEGG